MKSARASWDFRTKPRAPARWTASTASPGVVARHQQDGRDRPLAPERPSDVEAVVGAEADVEQYGVGLQEPDRGDRRPAVMGIRHHHVAARPKQLPGGPTKAGVIVDDQDAEIHAH